MLDVVVIEDAGVAAASLGAERSRLLAELGEPASAAVLARRLGSTRQRLNYHLKELERHGLVELVELRLRGNAVERIMRATARSYVISPAVMEAVQPDPSRSPDRLSATWLVALAARLVSDVGGLIGSAARAQKRLSTFALEAEVRFASPQDRAEFAAELTGAVTQLVAKYHDESATTGRRHRLVVAVHPSAEPLSGLSEKADA